MHEVGVVDPPTHILKIGSGIFLRMPARLPSDIVERPVSILSFCSKYLYIVCLRIGEYHNTIAEMPPNFGLGL